MTQDDKDLLLQDLCARLPYKTAVSVCGIPFHWDYENFIDNPRLFKSYLNDILRGDVKPYLFPLSSMTAEQKEFIKNKFCYDWDIDDHPYSLWTYCIGIGDVDELIDWFNKNHFDYRGLIQMGLAIDATGLNIY